MMKPKLPVKYTKLPTSAGDASDEFGELDPMSRYIHVLGVLGRIHKRICKMSRGTP